MAPVGDHIGMEGMVEGWGGGGEYPNQKRPNEAAWHQPTGLPGAHFNQ